MFNGSYAQIIVHQGGCQLVRTQTREEAKQRPPITRAIFNIRGRRYFKGGTKRPKRRTAKRERKDISAGRSNQCK